MTPPGALPAAAGDDAAQAVLDLVRTVADELRPQTRPAVALGLDHSLERDYGLDSLARAELLARIDQAFGVLLGEPALTDAETPRDLLRLVLSARPRRTAAAAAVVPMALPVGEGAGEEQVPPEAVATLQQVFDWHLQRHPDRRLITLIEDGAEPLDITYADLQREASAMAAGLHALGLARGDAVAIMLPTGPDFFAAFYGVVFAGMVPVPLYPPARPSQLEDHLQRVAGIVSNSGARALVTVERAKPLAHLLRSQAAALRHIATVADMSKPGATWTRVVTAATDIALLQYTSGSTGEPKGVVLSHANLLANLRAMWRASKVGPRDTFVSWLPLYHDMGLIGAGLGALYLGFHLVLMSPLAFLARPARWLQAIHRYRGTVSAAPNFAYELCLGKVDDTELADWDLSSWRLAFNGAEPVSPGTLERFAARFAACGLRREALTPVYGLAENAVGLAFPPVGRGPLIDRVDRVALSQTGLAKPARSDDPQPLRIVSCGTALPGHELRVADAGGHQLPEREQGRVQFRGPSATRGYLDNPAANQRLFDGAWLNTGDLGYIAGGELYLTGREKDIIIRGGFNVHPQELETAIAALAGVRKGGVAVFPASDERSGTERLVVLAETRLDDPQARRRLAQDITALSAALLGVPADDVVLAPPRSVLKTSSGKTRRAACRELYEQGRLGATQRAPWLQWLALVRLAALARSRRAGRRFVRLGWGLWVWTVLLSLGSLAWCLVMLVPGLALRRVIARRCARIALWLVALPVQVRGLEHLPDAGACVIVANHASYADSLLLGALLPPRFGFVAKRELARAPFVGVALRRLGMAFVERFDAARGVEDTQAMVERVRAGESFVVFPEGTFAREHGLLPFKLGAFVAAADTGVPLVPLALHGTRSVLPAGAWLPQRAGVELRLLPPRRLAGGGWDAAVAARDALRSALAAELSAHAREAR